MEIAPSALAAPVSRPGFEPIEANLRRVASADITQAVAAADDGHQPLAPLHARKGAVVDLRI